MSSHRTVIHLPVTFVTPPGTTPENYARFMASEAALMLEKFSNADDITVGEEAIDPITTAYEAPAVQDAPPTATSNADAAGWDDTPTTGGPAFVVSGSTGRWEIHAVDPAHNARPVTRAYGLDLAAEYAAFPGAAGVRDVLNRRWREDGGEHADIQTGGHGNPATDAANTAVTR